MSSLHDHLTDYLRIRRALGYKLARAEKLLPQFIDYLERRGEALVTIENTLAWVTLPGGSGAGDRFGSPASAGSRSTCTRSTRHTLCRRPTWARSRSSRDAVPVFRR
jgi:hypothetical protein